MTEPETTETVTETVTVTRTSGCPVCGGNDMNGLRGDLRQCINCGTTVDGTGSAVTEGTVDSPARVLATTPAQPLPAEALIEQEGAEDLDRVRGTTPPQPLPADAYDEPRVLGTTPPQPLPADAGQPAPAPVYADSSGAVSDSPPAVHGDPVTPPAPVEAPALVNPGGASEVAAPGSVGDQPQTDESYSTTSGFPTGETKTVTPGETPVEPDVPPAAQ